MDNNVNVGRDKLQKTIDYITSVIAGAGDMPVDITENGGLPEVIIEGFVETVDTFRKSMDNKFLIMR